VFSISQTSRGYFCLEWSSTEDGPKIRHLNHINILNGFTDKNIFSDIINHFSYNLKSQSNSLSVIINSDNVLISLLKINFNKNNDKIIKWYENKVMGNSFCNNYYNYYFPMDSDNNCLLISIPKKMQDNIVDSSNKLGFNLIYLSVDIFSAATLARQLYKNETRHEYLIWKINNNRNHMLVYYNEDRIKLFTKIKIQSNKIVADLTLGSIDDAEKVKNIIFNILINNTIDESIENIFLYQTKANTTIIKKIVDKNFANIKLLDFSGMIASNNYDKYKYISYVENGICFKGLDI